MKVISVSRIQTVAGRVPHSARTVMPGITILSRIICRRCAPPVITSELQVPDVHEWLRLLNAGHCGSVTSFHGFGAADAIERLNINGESAAKKMDKAAFRPSGRLIGAVVLFVLALAAGLFRPAVPLMPSAPGEVDGLWRGEVREIFSGNKPVEILGDAQLELSGPDELILFAGAGKQRVYQVKDIPKGMGSKEFFHLLRDEKTICLFIQPGPDGKLLADVRVTLPLLRRLMVAGNECSTSLSNFKAATYDRTQEKNDDR